MSLTLTQFCKSFLHAQNMGQNVCISEHQNWLLVFFFFAQKGDQKNASRYQAGVVSALKLASCHVPSYELGVRFTHLHDLTAFHGNLPSHHILDISGHLFHDPAPQNNSALIRSAPPQAILVMMMYPVLHLDRRPAWFSGVMSHDGT